MLRTLLLWITVGCTAPAWAAPADQPFEAYAHFVRGIYAQWYVPGADDFAMQSQALVGPLQQLCAADAATEPEALVRAQQQWLRTVSTWEYFSAVRGGALLARRSPRSLDFMPTRPEAIAEAVRTVAPDATTLETISAPAKGLPALEWLLWPGKLRAHTPACHYAEQLGSDILAEARALQSAYTAALQAGWDDQEAEYAMYEFLNLWNGALQKLWREDIDRTLQKINTGRFATFNRSASGHAAQAWAIHWQALRSLAIGSAAATQAPSVHGYLLANDHAPQAVLLQHAVAEVDHAMERLLASRDPAAASVPQRQLITALKELQHFAEKDLGPALQFTISFFDEDGD